VYIYKLLRIKNLGILQIMWFHENWKIHGSEKLAEILVS
jgi:hypothetical protein